MAEQVPVVCDLLATIEARHWDRLARLLHPEVTTAAEDELHGPHEVIACLAFRAYVPPSLAVTWLPS